MLVARGLVETRGRAQGLVMGGHVRVDGQVVTKAGTRVADDAAVEVAEQAPYVSRAGAKLATGLDSFGWDVAGAHALDVGASTGGFTDCLLQRGAAAVIALDVGYGQLHERVRTDPRVTVLERTNARDLDPAALPYRPDLVVADVSFISLTLVLGPALGAAQAPWRALVLVKPQFEAGREHVPKGGVVRDPMRARSRCRAGRPLRLRTWRGATRRRRLRPSGSRRQPRVPARDRLPTMSTPFSEPPPIQPLSPVTPSEPDRGRSGAAPSSPTATRSAPARRSARCSSWCAPRAARC